MIGKKIKERRLELGLSQEELAKKLGVSKSAIGNYETNVSSPKETILFKLFDVLKCDANFLYEDYLSETENFEITSHEKKIIKKYRIIDEYGKKAINDLLNTEYERCTEAEKLNETKPTIEVESTNTKPSKTYTAHAVAFGGANKHVEMTQDEYNELAEFLKSYEKK